MSLVRTLAAALAVAAVLGLPRAATAQTPDPRTKPETLVAEGIRLLEAKDYVKFFQVFAPPAELKQITDQGHTVEELANAFGQTDRVGALLAALKSVKDAVPTFDADGKTATYKLKEPVPGTNKDTLVFLKIGEFWYLQQG